MIGKIALDTGRRVWPRGDMKLLLEAAYLPDTEAAARSWSAWLERRSLESVRWREQVLLARVAPRLAAIDPDCPSRRHIEGVAKAHWAQSQTQMRLCAEAIEILTSHGVEVMLLKGAALDALGISNGLRLSGDVDIMVRRRDFVRAIEILAEGGWLPNERKTQSAKQKKKFKPGINVVNGKRGDLDIHHQPVHDKFLSERVLDALWSRASTVEFHGNKVAVPTPADLIVFASHHATHNNARRKPAAGWVFDIDLLVKHPAVDGRGLFRQAKELRAGMDVKVTLTYLLGVSDPDSQPRIAELLSKARVGPLDSFDFLFRTPGKLKRWRDQAIRDGYLRPQPAWP